MEAVSTANVLINGTEEIPAKQLKSSGTITVLFLTMMVSND